MREYFEKGIRVVEYTYEDWWDGVYETVNFGFAFKERDASGIEFYYHMNLEQRTKIGIKQQQIYWELVEEHVSYLISKFKRRWDKSREQMKLLEIERESYSQLIDENKFPLKKYINNESQETMFAMWNQKGGWEIKEIQALSYSYGTIYNIRKLYFKLIIQGDRNSVYHKIKSPNLKNDNLINNDYLEIEVDAIYKYINWLSTYNLPAEHATTEFEPSLREIALYYLYTGQEVNKENQYLLLVSFKQKSGPKLKQHYEHFRKKANRTNSDTKRKNANRKKEFGNVILMLKKTTNQAALTQAESEFAEFIKCTS